MRLWILVILISAIKAFPEKKQGLTKRQEMFERGWLAAIDSPPQEGEPSEREKRLQQQREELGIDCRCPQQLRDSISYEQIESNFNANYYDTLQLDPNIIYAANPGIERARREEDRRQRRIAKIHQNPALYGQLRQKQAYLQALKMQICCLIKFAKQDMGYSTVGEEIEAMRTHPVMKKYAALQKKINHNLALLNIDLEEYRRAKGNHALKLFRQMEKQFNDLASRTQGYSDDSIRAALRQPENMFVIQQLKAYLFLSDMPPNVNCRSGVGQWFKGLTAEQIGEIDPKSDCLGYVMALGKNHNLLILRVRGNSLKEKQLIDQVIAVIWRKVPEVRKVGQERPPAQIGAVDIL
ncbi:MAG: hypothetical protein RMJ44_09440 [Cytophagales bacterium]|nr:hypothetical protein [Bernardetiaceae bacterium]MDW8211298.1 hypothetical protein [Cytophagales bacterium]